MLSVGLHSHFSTPSSWKSKEAHSLALSFQVQTDSHVCRPCRDDLDRILRDPVHVPRLRKETKRECCIDNCRDISFVSSHIVNSKYEEALTLKMNKLYQMHGGNYDAYSTSNSYFLIHRQHNGKTEEL